MKRSNPFGCALVGFWFALLCLFVAVVHGILANYWISFGFDDGPIENYAVLLFIGVLLLSSASSWLDRIEPVKPILIALWLALMLIYGLQDLQHTVSWYTGDRFGTSGWLGYVAAGILIGAIPILVLVSKRIAGFGAIKLTVLTGFIIFLANDVVSFMFGDHWYSFHGSIYLGTIDDPNATSLDWIKSAGWWFTNEYWSTPRLMVYAGLGYVLARWKGIRLGLALSILIALVEITVGWIVFLPLEGLFEAAGLRTLLEYVLPSVIQAYLVQLGIVAFFALIGALLTRVRLPSFGARDRRHYTVRRIAPRSNLRSESETS